MSDDITEGQVLRKEELMPLGDNELRKMATDRGIKWDENIPKPDLIRLLINHREGPTSTLWGAPLPARAVDELEDPRDTLNADGRDIDAVLVFDIAPRDDVASDANWQRRETAHSYESRLTVLKSLHAKGLQLTQSLSLDQTQWIIRISAPCELLETTAERMGKKFKTKLKNSNDEQNRGAIHGYAEFRIDKRVEYEMIMTEKFRSVERQRIMLYIIETALGGNGEDYAKIKEAENSKLFHLFPTHTGRDQNDLARLWVSRGFLENQPLDKVRDYYGEEIAIYFAFLGFYTWMLMFPSLFGLITSVGQNFYGNDVILVPLYCAFVAIWSIIFLEWWKSYQAEWQIKWNVRDFEDNEVDRIEFYGETRVSPITGEDETFFSDEERYQKYLLTWPIMLASMLAVVGAAIGVVLFQFWATHSGVFGSYGSTAGGIINAVVIQAMNAIYHSIAISMNDHENHRAQTEYEDSLITKVFVFQFVNSYAAITYMAFFAGRVTLFGIELKCSHHGCMHDIQCLIQATLLFQIVAGNVLEVMIPLLTFKINEYSRLQSSLETVSMGSKRDDPEGPGLLDSVNPWYDEDEALLSSSMINNPEGFELPPYISNHENEAHMPVYDGTFSEYNEIVIQFGYVVLFAMALPYGSLLCMINNIIEIRSDAYKLVWVYQRPFYRGAQTIGQWYTILRVMVVMGVLFNCGQIALTSNIFLRNHWVTPDPAGIVNMLVMIFIFEHVALAIMIFAANFIPDEPSWIPDEEERLRQKADAVLRTKDDEDRSREVERIYREMQQLIDDHDIALLEDIAIKKWRKTMQYGSGMLAGIEPPTEVDHGENKGQPAKWLGDKRRQEERDEMKRKKAFEYDLY